MGSKAQAEERVGQQVQPLPQLLEGNRFSPKAKRCFPSHTFRLALQDIDQGNDLHFHPDLKFIPRLDCHLISC
jgi:hypothetical protein